MTPKSLLQQVFSGRRRVSLRKGELQHGVPVTGTEGYAVSTSPATPSLSSLSRQEGAAAWPVCFGDEARPAFGWFHSPAGGACLGGAVICPPLGQDYIRAHYALRLLAEQMAAAGFCALRFDYDGTGDSAGSDSDGNRAEAWLTTVRQAISLLRGSGIEDITLIGLRLGGTLAALAGAGDGGVDQVVLWDPYVSGRSFLREERLISVAQLGVQPSQDGSVEIPGFWYDEVTASEISALGLATCALPLARRALMLTRSDRPVDPWLLQGGLGRQETTSEEAVGQAQFISEYPPAQELPWETIRRVTEWARDGARTPPANFEPPRPAGPTVVSPRGAGHPAVVESPVFVPPAGLFGVLCRPEGPEVAGAPTVIFLSVALQHHVGPARLWVDMARRWAKAGVRSLRVDHSALGDSPRRYEGEQWVPRRPEAFDDVDDAIEMVSPDDHTNVVLVGLCSSGYIALESALHHKVRGVVSVNPALNLTAPERAEGRPVDPRRRIAILKDEVSPLFRQGGRLGNLRKRFPQLAWKVRLMTAHGHRSGTWLKDLVAQGTDTLIICGDHEIRPLEAGVTERELRRLRASGIFSLEHFQQLQHDLFVYNQRQVVSDRVTEHVTSRFGPAQPPT